MNSSLSRSKAIALPLGMVTVGLVLAGCAATAYDTWYRIGVTGQALQAPTATLTNSQQWAAVGATSSGNPGKFEDGSIAADWNLWHWNAKVKLHNKTDQFLTVLWPEARIAWGSNDDHLQNKDQREAQDTVLEPRSSATFQVFPLSLLQWTAWGDPAAGHGHWNKGGGSEPIFGRGGSELQTKEERQQTARRAVGETVRVLLPMIVRGERVNYVFNLEIEDARSYGVRF